MKKIIYIILFSLTMIQMTEIYAMEVSNHKQKRSKIIKKIVIASVVVGVIFLLKKITASNNNNQRNRLDGFIHSDLELW